MKNLLFVFFVAFLCCNNKEVNRLDCNDIKTNNREYNTYHKEALNYAKQNGFNQDFYYLLDFSIHSGKNRFFIYDFKKDIIIKEKLVTHGSCDKFEENPEKWEKAKFSTKNGSHCSMKGKYKIGKRDYSSWGINVKYWIHGLEKTNNTAVKRVVVLHSWEAVKNEEVYPKYSPLSWGCPAVSNEFMEELDEQLQKSEKPVLLWIID